MGKWKHYIVAADGELLSGDVAMSPRMVRKLIELSPRNVVALEIETKGSKSARG